MKEKKKERTSMREGFHYLLGRDLALGVLYYCLGGRVSPSGLPWDKRLVRYPDHIARIEDKIYKKVKNTCYCIGGLEDKYLIVPRNLRLVEIVDRGGNEIWEEKFDE
jgi:hypothetical protein